MKRELVGLLVFGLVLAVPSMARAEEQKAEDAGTWRLGVGTSYSQGTYEALDDTKVFSAPVSLKYKRGGFSVRVSVPFVSIEGPGTLLDTPQGSDAGGGDFGGGDDSGSDNSGSGSGSSGSGSSGSGSSGSGSDDGGVVGGEVVPTPGLSDARNGLGDISVTAGYSLEIGEGTYLDVSGRVKLPTASTEKRIGTGKTDFILGGDLTQDIGSFSIFAGGHYRFIGKPEGLNLRNTFGAGAGVSYRFPGSVIVGANYDWQESVVQGRKASGEMTGWVNFGLTPRIRTQLFVSTGVNSVSTDFAAGLSLSARLN